MQVTETGGEGLKREFRIVVPADELEDKVVRRLDELGRTIRLPGFRPGKVPMQLLRRRYGPSVLGEVVQSTVQDSSAETIREHNLRPALPPKVDIVSFSEGADLEYSMQLEVLPDIPEPDFGSLVVEVPEDSIEAAIGRMAEQQRKSEPVDRPAANGDILVVDVEGRVGGEEIPGAGGKDRRILLGEGGFVPGFEEQLAGAAAGEHRQVRVSFPADYAVAHLAGQEAVFEVDVKEVRERAPAAVDDELAMAVGLENLAELRQELREQMQRDYAAAARLRLKRALLDKLYERCDFPVPSGMVDLEFDNIWAQHQAEEELRRTSAAEADPAAAPGAAAGGRDSPPAGDETRGDDSSAAAQAEPDGSATTSREGAQPSADTPPPSAADEEQTRAEYRRIAERRVRLGLLLAEVGRSNNITVSQEELNQAITREVRRHPGYERQALDFYRQNPEAVASLRAPIFEDKVVDFIVELAKVPDRQVTPQELLALPDGDADAPVAGEPPAGAGAPQPY
jgi:trigger factor